MQSPVEKWLSENPDTCSDYAELVNRMRSGEAIECVIETGLGSVVSSASYEASTRCELFRINSAVLEFSVTFSKEKDFIQFCENSNVLFALYQTRLFGNECSGICGV